MHDDEVSVQLIIICTKNKEHGFFFVKAIYIPVIRYINHT